MIAVVGYQARLGKKGQTYAIEQKGKEKGVTVTQRSKEKWITTKDFDKIVDKIGEKYYKSVFSAAIENLYNKGYTYDDVKKAIDIPSTIGAKVSLEKFLQFV